MTETRKPFDHVRAAAGDPVETRDGRPFVFGGYNPEADEPQRVTGWVNGRVFALYENGRMYSSTEDDLDLYMIPRTVTLWVGVMRTDGPDGHYPTTEAYETREAAEKALTVYTLSRIGVYPIEVKVP